MQLSLYINAARTYYEYNCNGYGVQNQSWRLDSIRSTKYIAGFFFWRLSLFPFIYFFISLFWGRLFGYLIIYVSILLDTEKICRLYEKFC
jgi:hypothetical protein